MKSRAKIAFVSSAILGATLLLAPALDAQTAPPADYIKAVYAKVAQATVYPKMAKLRGQEGKVGCQVKISASGEVIDDSVESSSGAPILDEAALEAIKHAAPFQPPPGGDATLHLILNFALNG